MSQTSVHYAHTTDYLQAISNERQGLGLSVEVLAAVT
ncbi:hypothetical protein HG15A2_20370 [Adhaeretor mobilis]|uniref:Uncharacterized protein n=1 Tax=Adhaeretor mobilis TaxID=1930276 RepID=A0A517MV43_9BACT|nr:hypothetical protein HG15A2_20370 [Adhaeretor mobilis]